MSDKAYGVLTLIILSVFGLFVAATFFHIYPNSNATTASSVKLQVNVIASYPTPTTPPIISGHNSDPTLIAVGDVMLGRHVEVLMNQHGNNYPFQTIDSFLKSADTVVANLEGPIIINHADTPSGSMSFSFDTRVPQVLKDHNINIVNLANNHTYDFGTNGYFQTAQYLDNSHVLYAGNPFAIGDQYMLRTTINNKKFIFVGFNITNPNFDFIAANAYVRSIKKNPDEFLIAMVHGGDEYSLHSNETQETFYRQLIDDGVDLVLAHHPHVVEEVEQYKNKLIFYSLGNFIFDQYFSQAVQQELAVKIMFKKNMTEYDLMPVQSSNSQPVLMTGDAKNTFLESLAARSPMSLQSQIEAGVIDITQ